MTEKLPGSIWPEQFQILSGSALKMIAIITMLIDHTGFIILSKCPQAMEPLFFIGEKGFCDMIRIEQYRQYGIVLFGQRQRDQYFTVISEIAFVGRRITMFFYSLIKQMFTKIVADKSV